MPPPCLPAGRARKGLTPERREGLRTCLIISNCSPSALFPLIRDAGLGNWDTESCQTLETLPAHTKCQCRQLATFAVLAQLPKDLVGDRLGTAASLLGTRHVGGGDPWGGRGVSLREGGDGDGEFPTRTRWALEGGGVPHQPGEGSQHPPAPPGTPSRALLCAGRGGGSPGPPPHCCLAWSPQEGLWLCHHCHLAVPRVRVDSPEGAGGWQGAVRRGWDEPVPPGVPPGHGPLGDAVGAADDRLCRVLHGPADPAGDLRRLLEVTHGDLGRGAVWGGGDKGGHGGGEGSASMGLMGRENLAGRRRLELSLPWDKGQGQGKGTGIRDRDKGQGQG